MATTTWFGDGREQEILRYIFSLPNLKDLRGRPNSILSEIDKWSKNNKILMTIGQERGDIITKLITQTKPKVMAELGCYIGYSAIKFGSAVRDAGGDQYLSFEYSREWAGIAKQLIELAGLGDFVTIHIGSSSESLVKFGIQPSTPKLDFLFLDHAENLYRKDLQICERLELLSSGTVIVADNVSGSRAKDYVDWVTEENGSSDGTRGRYESHVSSHMLPNGQMDGMVISRYIQ
ncbi:catechol o-methyltransferase-like protein [Aspergillus pseudocaelatus]|uniref:catechol O-methyltransferase n=1 Tax=Aspergillus pseudocaelatus TaxID=1825620 RepID=A0ABQ6X2W6_9EURO|nr:catechol o-methyltransferase-like protein [Aspergillus pseudocaelatus]